MRRAGPQCLLGLVAVLAAGPATGQAWGQPPGPGDGRGALPGVDRVGFVATAPPLVSVRVTGGYGFTEAVLRDGDAHHRLDLAVAASVRPSSAVALGLEARGRYDRHSGEAGSDRGLRADPRLFLRVGDVFGELGIAGQLRLWLPASESVADMLGATTLDAELLASYAAGEAGWVSGLAGFRYDRSAESTPEADGLSRADRLSLGVSDSHAVLLGAAGALRLGAVELLGEVTLDLLVGADAPGVAESPIRLASGARWHASDAVQVHALVEVAASRRPTVGVGQALVVVEPRARLEAGVAYRLHRRTVAVATLEGRITDPQGAPVAGARVEAEGLETTSDEEGRFRFEDVPPGEYAVSATAEGRLPAERTVTAAPGTSTRITLVLAEVPRAPVGRIAGVVETYGGAPLPEAEVRVGERTTTTDAEGRFVLEDVPAGPARVEVAAERMEPSTRSVDVRDRETSEVQIALDAQLPSAEIRGTVQAFRGGAVPATVRLEPGGQEVRVAEDGTYAIEVVPGSYLVVVTADGYREARQRVRVQENAVVVVVVDLRPDRR